VLTDAPGDPVYLLPPVVATFPPPTLQRSKGDGTLASVREGFHTLATYDANIIALRHDERPSKPLMAAVMLATG
jgi:hypothetical protein